MFGGDGITPDYCVEQETPNKFVSYLIARQAFTGFARGYDASEGQDRAAIAGTGSRSQRRLGQGEAAGARLPVDDAMLAEFQAYLGTRKLRFTEPDLQQNRDGARAPDRGGDPAPGLGRGEARRKSMAWDPQVQKALELVPKAELLLRDPKALRRRARARPRTRGPRRRRGSPAKTPPARVAAVDASRDADRRRSRGRRATMSVLPCPPTSSCVGSASTT